MSWISKPPPGSMIDWGHPLSRDQVDWWMFNEGAGSKISDIISGRHGTLTNMDPASDWVGSPYG